MKNSRYNPDCGYAWIVVAACFTINFIMAGLARSAGVLYVALIDVYDVSREVATTPFSLRFCIRNLSGPAVGALGQRFGIRPIVLLGGLICGLGGILSALAPDVTWITVAWGGIHGLGYGMCNIIHVIAINRYFNKYKGFALGISYTGDCIGTFLLPLLLEFLLPIYDLKGTFLILAGISLNVVPAAMLLRSPTWEEKVPASISKSGRNSSADKTDEQGIRNRALDFTQEEYSNKPQINNMEYIIPIITINDDRNNQKLSENEPSMISKNEEFHGPKKAQSQYVEFYFSDKNKNNIFEDSIMLNDIYTLRESSSLRVKDKNIKKKHSDCNISNINANRGNRRTSVSSVLSCPSHFGKCTADTQCENSIKRQILYTGSTTLHSMKDTPYQSDQKKENTYFQHRKDETSTNGEYSTDDPTHIKSQINLPTIYGSLCNEKFSSPVQIEESMDTKIESHYGKIDEMTQPKAFNKFLKTNSKPILLVISTTMATFVFLFISVFTIIIDYASDNNVPSEYGKYLIIAFSVTDTFGRVGFGIVLDKNWIPLRYFAGLTVGLMGFFVLVIPIYKCFTFWMISFSLCGFVQGGTAIMFPGLVEYYMEKNEESVALGSLNFYGGILMFPIPPMIGYFRDNIGSYDGVFFTVGALCIFAASLWMLEPCLVRKHSKVTKKTVYVNDDKI